MFVRLPASFPLLAMWAKTAVEAVAAWHSIVAAQRDNEALLPNLACYDAKQPIPLPPPRFPSDGADAAESDEEEDAATRKQDAGQASTELTECLNSVLRQVQQLLTKQSAIFIVTLTELIAGKQAAAEHLAAAGVLAPHRGHVRPKDTPATASASPSFKTKGRVTVEQARLAALRLLERVVLLASEPLVLQYIVSVDLHHDLIDQCVGATTEPLLPYETRLASGRCWLALLLRLLPVPPINFFSYIALQHWLQTPALSSVAWELLATMPTPHVLKFAHVFGTGREMQSKPNEPQTIAVRVRVRVRVRAVRLRMPAMNSNRAMEEGRD